MNTVEVNNPLRELKLNQSVPQNLLKSDGKEKSEFWKQLSCDFRKKFVIIVPVNYDKKKGFASFTISKLFVVNTPFKL